jgi:hypothetical protein
MTAVTRKLTGAWIVLALAAGLAAVPSNAFAAEPPPIRTYDTQITGFVKPGALAVTADDEVWITDLGNGKVSRYAAYPALTKLGVQPDVGIWGGQVIPQSIAVNELNDFLYVGSDEDESEENFFTTHPPLALIDNFGDLYSALQPSLTEHLQQWVAVDNNPQSDYFGQLYDYEGDGRHSLIERFDAYGNPVPFSGSAGYISGNEITGTPSGPFGGGAGNISPVLSGITIDPDGNIWAIKENEIDEFAPSGIFLQRITAESAGVPPTTNQAGTHQFGSNPGLTALAVDPTNGDLLVSDRSGMVVDEFSPQGKYLGRFSGAETPQGSFGSVCVAFGEQEVCWDRVTGLAVDSEGRAYVTDGYNGVVDVFNPRPAQPTIGDKPDTNPTATGGTVNALVDLNGGGNITGCKLEYGSAAEAEAGEYKIGTLPCSPDPSGGNFTGPTEVHVDLSGLTSEATYHYRWTVANATTARIGPDHTFTPHNVLGLRAEAADAITSSSATLHGSFVGNGAHTTYYFEYGTSTSYGSKAPLPVPPGGDAGSPAGPGRTSLEASINGLEPVTRYHYRIVAENGSTSYSEDNSFRTLPVLPQVKEFANDVHSEAAVLNARVNPGGADTVYHFEYGTEDCSIVPDPCTAVSVDRHIGMNMEFDPASQRVQGLKPGTTYYFRVVATNSAGTVGGAGYRFVTYPYSTDLTDPCPNALARQQTGAALLTDCRAYELVSATSTGGYDVESSLVPNQEPFEGYPRAQNPSRVLYGVHSGAIPGIAGNPPNHGVDPYVATRGEDGWSTSFVGISADNPNATAPFASTLAEADEGLHAFAFGGPDICSPCFDDGSTGIPVRTASGSLVQGMQGSLPVTDPEPSGEVRKHFSGDGGHFVFGSEQQFEPEGNPDNGNVTIYDRDLGAGSTQVVSTLPSGATIEAGSEVAALDVSDDGSRILIGQKISTDPQGNEYFHLYMHIGDSPNSVDLTPGTTSGVLYGGMSADGSKVYYATKDQLLPEDTDSSADIYEAEVAGSGPATISLISVAGANPSNSDACSPAGNSATPHWNSATGATVDCSAVLIGGTGGVSANGAIYFLSPELLAGPSHGTLNAPNLFVSREGEEPRFVATLESGATAPLPPPSHQFQRAFGSFTTPEGAAIDRTTGSYYVFDTKNTLFEPGAYLQKFTSTGSVDSSFGTGGKINGSESPTGSFVELGNGEPLGLSHGVPTEIAVDNNPASPNYRDIFVADDGNQVVDKFGPSGNYISQFPLGTFDIMTGIAIDQSNGHIYVTGLFGHAYVFDSNGNPVAPTSFPITEFAPTSIAVDSAGNPYVADGTETLKYDSSGGSPVVFDANPSNGVAVDPLNDHVYVDEGDRVVEFTPAGTQVGVLGKGELSDSVGVGVDSGSLVVTDIGGGNARSYGAAAIAPGREYDNPLVIDSVRDAAARHTDEFQVTPTGDYAVFTTNRSLDSNFANEEHTEIYRYSASDGAVECISCAPSDVPATADAGLAPHGLSLSDDGRVFFESKESLVLRDGDNRVDVYEWEKEGAGPDPGRCQPGNPNLFLTGACVSLISSGTSQFDSRLLSASADGRDAYFFTHDTLAHEDVNGPLTKIYDARTDGGFFDVPPPAKCAASDECHGPGTVAAESPPIRTIAGTPETGEIKRGCKRKFVKKHGRCVRRRHSRHHHRRTR